MPGRALPLVTDDASARVRGACPSVSIPFAAADGALVRVRVPDGTLTTAQLRAVAAVAAPGPTIEITSRANLQLRALTEDGLQRAAAVLAETGLVAPTGDERRDVVVGPLAGIDPAEVTDPRPLARVVAAALAAVPGPVAPKFGVLLDGGGRAHLRGRPHALALGALRLADGTVAWEVVVDGALPLARPAQLRVVASDDVPQLAVRLATGRAEVPEASLVAAPAPRAPAGPAGPVLGWGPGTSAPARWFGAAPVLGRMSATQAAGLAALADRAAAEVRLSPWRGVVLPAVTDVDVPEALGALGFVVDDTDPAAHVVACVGAAGCAAGAVDAAGDARAVIAALRAAPRDGRPTTIHVSGCVKGCASRARHDVTFVGRDDGTYDVFDGRVAGEPLGAEVAHGVVAEQAVDLAVAP